MGNNITGLLAFDRIVAPLLKGQRPSLDVALLYDGLAKRIAAARFTILDAHESSPQVYHFGKCWTYRTRLRLGSLTHLSNVLTSSTIGPDTLDQLPEDISLTLEWEGSPTWQRRDAMRGGVAPEAMVLTSWGAGGALFAGPNDFFSLRDQVERSNYFSFKALSAQLQLRDVVSNNASSLNVPLEFELPAFVVSGTATPQSARVEVQLGPLVSTSDIRVLVQWSESELAIDAVPISQVATENSRQVHYDAQFPKPVYGDIFFRATHSLITFCEQRLTTIAPEFDEVLPASVLSLRPQTRTPGASEEFFHNGDWRSIYTERGQLGVGGFGRVLLVEDQFRQLLALKIVRQVDDAGRLAKEIRALRQLNNAHIVEVLHAAADLSWYVMPVADGNLEEVVQSLLLTERIDVLLAVARALHAVHTAGLIHRDVTPRNVLRFKGSGQGWRLSDFGLVRRFPGQTTAVLTDVAIGTPRYMAPEAMSDPHRVDHTADLYSFGQLMCFVLTGREPPGQRRQDLGGPFAQLVSSLTSQNPAERPQSAEMVIAELDRIRTFFLSRDATVLDSYSQTALTRAELEVLKTLLVNARMSARGLAASSDNLTSVGAMVAIEKLRRRRLVLVDTLENGDAMLVEITESGRDALLAHISETELYRG